MTAGFEAMAKVDRLMSYHRPDSDLTRLNRAQPNEWIKVDPATAFVFQTANDMFSASQGIFDVRCGGALAKAGILPKMTNVPDNSFDYGEAPVKIKGRWVCKTSTEVMDLGGIAKGYAVDCAGQLMRDFWGKKSFTGIVNAGGDLKSWGDRVFLSAVKIPIGETSVLKSFKAKSIAIATSSVRVGLGADDLTLSAHVKMPSREFLTDSLTVTVFAKECLWADALTKIVLLASPTLAARCLSLYNARAVVFAGDGRLESVVN